MKIALALVVSCAVVALVYTQEFENMKVVKLPLDMLSQDQHSPQARDELQMQPDQFQRRGGKGNDSPPPAPGWGWGPPPMAWGPPPMMGWGGGPAYGGGPGYGR